MSTDRITMQFPADTGYNAAIRLAVSGIAGKLDYRVDEIEDIKACVSEACLLLMNGQKCSRLDFDIDANKDLSVAVRGEDVVADDAFVFEDFNEEISRIMIEALSDECAFTEEDGLLCEVSFEKKHTRRTEMMS